MISIRLTNPCRKSTGQNMHAYIGNLEINIVFCQKFLFLRGEIIKTWPLVYLLRKTLRCTLLREQLRCGVKDCPRR